MGLFSTKTKVKPLILPEQRKFMKSGLSAATPGALERLRMSGVGYQGDLSAPMSKYERTGLDNLEDWLNMPSPSEGKLYGLGGEEYEKTLSGDYYDPTQGAYWDAFNKAMNRELEEAYDRLAATTSSRDKYFSSGRVAGQAELEEQSMMDRALVLGELMERERERRLATVPAMTDYLRSGEMLQEGRVAASQRYGALERELEQAALDREYQEWIRQLQDLGVPLQTAVALATHKPDWSATTSGGEGWGLLGGLASLAALGSMGGGGMDLSSLLFGDPNSANLAQGTGLLGRIGL